MASTSNIAIAILAAGASKRMGSPKQLLSWGESTLINHAITFSKNTKANKVIVILGANGEAISMKIEDVDVSVVINNEWQKGLGKSIATAAQFILDLKQEVDGLLIVLADQPFVTSEYLDEMIAEFDKGLSKIVATSYDSKKIGVPALFGESFFTELSQLSGDEGAKSLIKKYDGFVKVQTPNFNNFDIDTKADYEKFSKEKFG